MIKTYSGRCLCGAVTYHVVQPPIIVAQCHCDECRMLSGTGHSIGAMFPKAAVTMIGSLRKFSYFSAIGSTVVKSSCANCASPMCGINSRSPDHITLTLGTMDDADSLHVEVVIFDRDKPHWDCLGPDVMMFETQPDWSPDT